MSDGALGGLLGLVISGVFIWYNMGRPLPLVLRRRWTWPRPVPRSVPVSVEGESWPLYIPDEPMPHASAEGLATVSRDYRPVPGSWRATVAWAREGLERRALEESARAAQQGAVTPAAAERQRNALGSGARAQEYFSALQAHGERRLYQSAGLALNAPSHFVVLGPGGPEELQP